MDVYKLDFNRALFFMCSKKTMKEIQNLDFFHGFSSYFVIGVSHYFSCSFNSFCTRTNSFSSTFWYEIPCSPVAPSPVNPVPIS